jgi:Lrp/AsnC family transcriptional regulator, leucine-responsive regulatory protein
MSTLYLGHPDKLLDDTGWAILRELQSDARLPYAEIGRRVGLSAPAVMERVRRMEEVGIIKGYRAEINLEKVGAPILAFVRVANAGIKEDRILDVCRQMCEVLECHHVLGHECYYIKVAVATMHHLERVLGQLSRYSQTTTTIVLSSPIDNRPIESAITGESEMLLSPIYTNGNGHHGG